MDSSSNTHLYNLGDILWTLTSMALIWIMIAGAGFIYSGLLRRKNALSMLYLSSMTFTVVTLQVRLCHPFFHPISKLLNGTFQWVFWGFSLVYSDTGGWFISDLSKAVDFLLLKHLCSQHFRVLWSEERA